MKKKIILRLGIGLFAVITILSTVLFLHIYDLTHKPKSDYEARAIGRIDFKQELSENEFLDIRNQIVTVKGIENANYITSSKMLVYTYNSNKISNQTIYQIVKTYSAHQSELYVPTENETSMGCPAIGNKNTFRYKLTTFIAQL